MHRVVTWRYNTINGKQCMLISLKENAAQIVTEDKETDEISAMLEKLFT